MHKFSLQCFAMAGLLCVTSFAQAQSFNFNITGTITMGTCTISANNGKPVDVGTFNSNLFTGAFQSGFIPNFTIDYTNCGAGIKTLQLKLTGTADKTTGGNVNYWDSTLPGAPFELKDAQANVTLPPTGATIITINNPGTSGSYPLTAQFHQTGALITTGTGSTTVTVNATYL
jgi:type 1 fimbria pilin